MPATFALLDLPGGGAVHATNLLRTLTLCRDDDFDATCAAVESACAAGHFVVAALDYELGALLEPKVGPVPDGVLGRFWVFARGTVLGAAACARLLDELAGQPPRPAALLDFSPQCDEASYARAVQRIRDYIAAGDCYQVNFTFPCDGRLAGDVPALYARLRAAQPVAHGGLVVTPGFSVMSLSPELFVERQGRLLRARPMKGTAPRHDDAAADAAAREALRRSAKDRAENVMIVDLLRNDLGRVADAGSVRVETLCEVETYPSVFQMTSTVLAESDARLGDVLRALFPCGSIAGAPKLRAMQIARELETQPRGLYTGALGWIGSGGDFSFNVAIRTLLADSAGRVRLGVGSGIVWDSVAADEYRECLLKARFVAAADPGFRLIETLRLLDGDYPLLDGHLCRLQRSAAAFGFAFDRERIVAELRALAAPLQQGLHRVRLTLGRGGDVELHYGAIPPLPSGQRTAFAVRPLDSGNPWLRHKSTVRAAYDEVLAALPPGTFDLIFCNERGEVCEGARSNVFVRREAGGPLLTPPVACGLLPGVLRGQLLAEGRAVEQVLAVEDVRSAAELYLGNALRGLVRVSISP